ncbi:MAG: LysM peptidoglycan-binding domain-containing protein [Rickettsiales bacterium]|jgi:nucleoid-associated protein YgaU|nr:LysM peptidoglycan-binding domain-containing protein [Rickettsiales bacterium]
MFGKKKRFSDMGSVGRDTNHVIDESIERQQEIKKVWAGRRPSTLAVSNPKPKAEKAAAEDVEPIAVLPKKPSSIFSNDKKGAFGFISNYWFPLLCLGAVIGVAVWTFWPKAGPQPAIVPEPVVNIVEVESEPAPVQAAEEPKPVERAADAADAKCGGAPKFDIVRIEAGGAIVVAGKCADKVSILLNGKIVATVAAGKDGDFVYAPKNKLAPGNYVLQMRSGSAASEKVFVYIAEKPGDSMSLLMGRDGTKVLHGPKSISGGALVVSQIDYVGNKRLVVSGKALPRLRATLSMDGKLLGSSRVSDHRNFGLGAGVGELKPGEKHVLSVKLHDSKNTIVANVEHEFVMPDLKDEAFYVVRRGDCLWIIARNYFGRGIRFSVIAAANGIKNPDLIYPDRKLTIPVK